MCFDQCTCASLIGGATSHDHDLISSVNRCTFFSLSCLFTSLSSFRICGTNSKCKTKKFCDIQHTTSFYAVDVFFCFFFCFLLLFTHDSFFFWIQYLGGTVASSTQIQCMWHIERNETKTFSSVYLQCSCWIFVPFPLCHNHFLGHER